MTQVDFYVLADPAPAARLAFVARFVEQLHHKGHRAHIHLDDAARLSELDQLLWTATDIGFIPHEIATAPVPDCPITLGMSPFSGDDEVLINLAQGVPEFFSHFLRVAEIIQDGAKDIEEARNRYRFYHRRGYKLRTHHIA